MGHPSRRGKEGLDDPPRDWKRTGALLASGCLTWTTVLVFGIVWHGLLAPAIRTDYSGQQTSGDIAIRLYLKATFQHGRADDARQYLCGQEYDGPSPEQIIEEVEASPMGNPAIVASDGIAIVSFKNGGPFDKRTYKYEVQEAGYGSCVMSLKETE